MKDIIMRIVNESRKVKECFIQKNASKLIHLAEYVANTFNNNGKIMLCGNGGSAADAQHIAAEFVNRFQFERPPLPALALTTDTSILTSVANDYGYEEIFSRQIKALGMKEDILLAISTSGRSKNVISAIKTAKKKGLYTVSFIGGDGGEVLKLVDLALTVESENTPRVQEVHILAGHILCELVERILFSKISLKDNIQD